jgi:UDP-glucose 4-epimerase
LKIVVTGALGHIGSYLIRDLGIKFPKSEIIMIDNLMTQRFPSLFNLPKESSYSFIEGNVNHLDLVQIFNGASFVVHLAAITDAESSFDYPEQIEENNYESTVNVANACLQSNSALIAISSTSVYGSQEDEVDETCNDSDLLPQSPYARIKIKEENYISKLNIQNGLRSIHCRFGTIYGASPGMRFHTAVNKFCWQTVMGKPITVWKTAFNQYRPYLDISDACSAISFIIENNLFDGQIYNVLTDNHKVKDVIETLKGHYPDLKINYVESKIMNQLSYKVLCEKFKSKGFESSGSLQRGIGETIDLLRNSNSFI